MVRVRRATVLDAPIDAVWGILRDFNGHDRWHPIVERSALEAGRRTDQVGAVRNFVLPGGERVREVLLSLSDRERRLRYAILDSDLPLQDYVAEFFLRPVTDGDRTFWSWRSRFRTPPGEEQALARLVGEQVYEAGFDGVRNALGIGERNPTTGARTSPAPGAASIASTLPALEAGTTAALRTSSLPGGSAPSRATAGGTHAGNRPAIPGPRGAVEGEAMVIARHGGPEVFRSAPMAAPPPGPGEVRLRHTAIGVNYIDVTKIE